MSRASRRVKVMRRQSKRLAWTSALLAVVASIAPALAGEQAAAVRNCTWCHGTSAQGYAIAPRLAGQRPLYLENQIWNFRDHVRDNPLSRQYMWNAVPSLRPDVVHELAAYFATILAQGRGRR